MESTALLRLYVIVENNFFYYVKKIWDMIVMLFFGQRLNVGF